MKMDSTKTDTTTTLASMVMKFTKKLELNTTKKGMMQVALTKMGIAQGDQIGRGMAEMDWMLMAMTKTDMMARGLILKE